MTSDEPKRALIAERIREARKMAGLSQGQVAKILNLHRPSVSQIEAGERRVSAEELGKLAEIFEVSMAWLVGDAPEKVASDDPRVQLAARELSKLKPHDLDRLLKLIATMRDDVTKPSGGKGGKL